MNLEIYGTLGPSCSKRTIIEQMIQKGMTGIRLNLSHCNLDERKKWIDAFHDACKAQNQHLDLLIDMRGPELRILESACPIECMQDDEIILDQKILPDLILQHAEIDDILLIDDGKIQCKILKNSQLTLHCQVLCPGTLKPRKNIAIKEKSLLGPVMTESDLMNLRFAKEYGVTSIMQPFVTCGQDLLSVRSTLKKMHLEDLRIYAKIENMEGVHHLQDILPHCDVIVIARGDLANACTLEKLPCTQKDIEAHCHLANKPYMVVTEMLHSMINHPVATRAEVSDIFHAVYHGASAIMLTAETASGAYPIEAMHTFTQVAKHALAYKKENKK